LDGIRPSLLMAGGYDNIDSLSLFTIKDMLSDSLDVYYRFRNRIRDEIYWLVVLWEE
jgi:hypothetical protein